MLLRPLTPADVDAVFAYQSQPDVVRYVPYTARSREQVLESLTDPARVRSELAAPGEVLHLAVVVDGALVGDVVLIWTSDEHRSAEIGWIFDPAVRGRGYATCAGRALLGLAFDGMGLHRVTARLDDRNDASARVCRRLGMRQEAHFVRTEWFKGEWTDELVFAVLAEEWTP